MSMGWVGRPGVKSEPSGQRRPGILLLDAARPRAPNHGRDDVHGRPRPSLGRRQGLYDPAFEHDACGVAFVVDLHGRKSHERVRQGITALCNLSTAAPRAARSTPATAPASRSRSRTGSCARPSPSTCRRPAQYATGIAFLPAEPDDAAKAVATLDDIAARGGRHRPRLARRPHRRLDARGDGRRRRCRPSGSGSSPKDDLSGIDLDRWAYVVRKRGRARGAGVLPVAVGLAIVVYKGMLTTPQLEEFYPDLARRAGRVARSRSCTRASPRTRSRAGRSRTRTGTSRTTARSTPLKGNRNWMRAREALLASRPDPRRPRPHLPDLHARTHPTPPSFDEVLELLAPRRPVAPARGADDDPGGVGEPRLDEPGEAARSTASTRR